MALKPPIFNNITAHSSSAKLPLRRSVHKDSPTADNKNSRHTGSLIYVLIREYALLDMLSHYTWNL